jgi:hypothetical protein
MELGMLTEEQVRVSVTDPNYLKRWLQESGRRWILMNAVELVDSLPWPDGVNDFKRVVDHYRAHRLTIPTGRVETQMDSDGKRVEVSIQKGEVLEPEEKLLLYKQLKEELESIGVL